MLKGRNNLKQGYFDLDKEANFLKNWTKTNIQALFLCVFRKLKVGLKKLKPEFEQEIQGFGVNLKFCPKNQGKI